MSNKEFIVKVVANHDELGELEEFTWDLSPTVDSEKTLHLNENGLPKVGSMLSPGMIVVGKIGKTQAFLSERKPTSLELNGLSYPELHERFGHLWKNTSEYVPEGVWGVVQRVELIEDGVSLVAVVELQLQKPYPVQEDSPLQDRPTSQ